MKALAGMAMPYHFRHCEAAERLKQSRTKTEAAKRWIASSLTLLAMTFLTITPAAAQDITTGLVGHWAMNESGNVSVAADSAGSNNGALTSFPGNPTANWVAGQIAGALDFDGSDDRVIIGDPVGGELDFGTAQSFTMSVWINMNNAGSLSRPISKGHLGWTGGGYAMWIDNGKLAAGTTGTSQATSTIANSDAVISNGSWYHAVAVIDQTAKTIKLYVNGVARPLTKYGTTCGTASGTEIDYAACPTATASTTSDFVIGASHTDSENFDGLLDDVRIYNRALSAPDIAALYALGSGSAPPLPCNAGHAGVMIYNDNEGVMQYCNATDWIDMGPKGSPGAPTDGLIHHWPLDETATPSVDVIGGYNGTWTGSVTSTTGPTGNALNFANAYVSIGDIPALNGVAQLTLSAWMKRTALNGAVLLGKQVAGGGHAIASEYWTTGTYDCGVSDATYDGGSTALNDTSWHHVAMVYDGTQTGNANRLKCFIDGVQQSPTYTGTVPATTTANTNSFHIGRLANDNSAGAIDDVRIYNRPLDATEIQSIYLSSGGTTSGTCTSPAGVAGEVDYNYTRGQMQYCNGANWISMGPRVAGASPADNIPTTGLLAHWAFEDGTGSATAADSAGSNTGTLTNMDAATDWVTGKNGGGLDFDNGNDFVRATDFLGAETELTVSAWVYPRSWTPAGFDLMVSQADTASFNGSFSLAHTTGTSLMSFNFRNAGMTSVAATAPEIPLNTWSHITGTYDGANVRLYINGVLQDTQAQTGAMFNPANVVTVGAKWEWGAYPAGNAAHWFDGVIDEVYVYNQALSAAEVQDLFEGSGGNYQDDPPNITGLTHHWALDDGTGSGTAADSAGANTGTLTNMNAATAWVTGKDGDALNFNWGTDYVAMTSRACTSLPCTITGWFKADTITNSNRNGIFRTNEQAAYAGIGIYVSNTGELKVRSGNGGGTLLSNQRDWDTAPGTIQTGQWYHFAVSVSAISSPGTKIYINGQDTAIAYEEGTSVTYNQGTGVANIGRAWRDLGGFRYWDGQIDDIRVYNRALSAAEAKALYLSTGGGGVDLGACSSPAGVAGEMVYNATNTIMQYCNGTDWVGIR